MCQWTIHGPENRRIKLTFEDFDLEPPIVNYYPGRNQTLKSCNYDYVFVASGAQRGYRTPAFSKLVPFNFTRNASQI